MERIHKQIPKQRPAPPEEIDPLPEFEPNPVAKAAGEFLVRLENGSMA